MDMSAAYPHLITALMPVEPSVLCGALLCALHACGFTASKTLSQGCKAAASVPRHAAPPPARAADDWAAAEAWSEWDAAPGCRAGAPEQPRCGRGRPHDPAGPPAANTRACVAHAQDAGKARRACGWDACGEFAAACSMWRTQKLGQDAMSQYARGSSSMLNKPGSALAAQHMCKT